MMDENGLYDIYGTWHVPFWQTNLFFYVTIAFGLLIALLMVFLVVYKLKKRAYKQLYWQKVLGELYQLRKLNIVSKPEGHRAYCQLTDLIKWYCAHRFGQQAEGLTDDELIHFLGTQAVTQDELRAIALALAASGTIKFAGDQALREQFQEHVEVAIRFISATKPIEQKK